MNVTFPLIALLLAGAAFYGGWRVTRRLRANVLSNRSLTLQLKHELADAQAFRASLEAVLKNNTGGVGKRISETRQIAEAVFAHNPAIFAAAPGLIHWLKATDEFLVELMRSSHTDDEYQRHVAGSQSAAIYQHILGGGQHVAAT